MKIKHLLVLILAIALFSGCSKSPKRAATNYMNNLKEHNFVAAAECCGISKDKTSQQLQIAMLEEKYGAKENSVKAFVITSDSTYNNKQNAIVTMNVVYGDLHREDSIILKMRIMNNKWIVQPFE